MLGLGMWEIMLILAIALMVLGPERLPKLASQLGRGVREVRKAARDLQSSFQDAADQRPNPPVPQITPPKQPGSAADATFEERGDKPQGTKTSPGAAE